MRVTEPYTIFLRTLPSGKKVYYYQYRDENGVRSSSYSCGTSKKAVAMRLCQKLYNEGKFQQSKEITFRNFSKDFFSEDSEFCEWRRINEKPLAPSSRLAYENLLETHLIPYFGKMQIKKITVDTVKNWVIWTKDKCSPKTSNNAQTVLNTILKSAKEKKLIDSNPVENITFRKVQRKNRQLLTTEELNKVYKGKWLNENLKNAFLVTAITGMRIGEVTGLLSENIESDRLNVKHSLHPKFGLGQTKTRINRFVPIPKSLDLKSKSGKTWVFEQDDGTPINENAVYRNFIKICKTLGIDTKQRGITVHSLRNTFISYMRGSSFGESIDLKIKAVVGHSDNSMTDWYTYWTPEMFPEIYQIQEELYKKIIGDKNEN